MSHHASAPAHDEHPPTTIREYVLIGLVLLRGSVVFVPWLFALACARHAKPKTAPVVPGRLVLLGRRALHFEGRAYQLGSSPIWIERPM